MSGSDASYAVLWVKQQQRTTAEAAQAEYDALRRKLQDDRIGSGHIRALNMPFLIGIVVPTVELTKLWVAICNIEALGYPVEIVTFNLS